MLSPVLLAALLLPSITATATIAAVATLPCIQVRDVLKASIVTGVRPGESVCLLSMRVNTLCTCFTTLCRCLTLL